MHNIDGSYSFCETERHNLRRAAGYVGVMMLAIEATMFVLAILLAVVKQFSSLDSFSFLLVYAVIYSVGMAVPAIAVSCAFKRRYFPLSPCAPTNPVDAFLGILSAVGICMAANIAVNYIMFFFELIGIPEPTMPDYLEKNIPSLLLNIFVFAVLPALLEELVFRGYVLRAFRVYGDWFAVSVSSLLFGLMHGNIMQIPFALIVGFALGWLYVATNNIWVPISVHFINNGFSLLLQYSGIGLGNAQKGTLNVFCILGLIAIGAVCLVVLFLRRSVLVRRQSAKSSLSLTQRWTAVLTSPLFFICVAMFLWLTVKDVIGSMK